MKTKKKHSTHNNIKRNVNEKEMMKNMEKEVEQILRTTDYSKIDVAIYTDVPTKRIIIPKAVFALATVNPSVMNWLIASTNQHPDYMQVFIGRTSKMQL